MKLLLSTSNIINTSPSTFGRPTTKSSSELTTSLLSNFKSLRSSSNSSYKEWTNYDSQTDTLYIPTPEEPSPGLSEERSQYDITVKLFYLPGVDPKERCTHTKEAIDCVLKELGVDNIDLLIVSFPNIVFDAEDESSDDSDEEGDDQQKEDTTSPATDSPSSSPLNPNNHNTSTNTNRPEPLTSMLRTWSTLETLHSTSAVTKLGLSEFGSSRLSKFLNHPSLKTRPSINQINVRDCCVVPKPLIVYAKQQGIELLTHSDCTDILPRGTLRELLGGVGVLEDGKGGGGLRGDVVPKWVVKYTAVVRDRGIVEAKGYFGGAELVGC
ncbi:hypothetical protein EJ08DRAFT_736475 [Tothia fuscella]|uniref:GCS light chain n=1 Tax=Tothia fuscella TaxID=1048955 RepID=A0A9P4NLV0_9PEZI|nr:hypothetical protein EJ08DRAFT_736475 [Tothia fuscella]